MMGTYGLATTAAPIVAPTIAGLLIDVFGWKSIFYIVLVIMVFSFVLSMFAFENVLEVQDKKFDVISFIESIFAFGGITLGIGNITSCGLISIQAGAPLLVGMIVCVLFVIRQCGLEKPFLDLKILSDWNYAVSVISAWSLSGNDGILGDDAPVCPECHGIFCRSFRAGHASGFPCDHHRQSLCRKDL